jgi:hypothetical protein
LFIIGTIIPPCRAETQAQKNKFIDKDSAFLFHIAAAMLYGKFNSLYGVVLFHALVDWSSDIFKNDTDPLWMGSCFPRSLRSRC